MFKDPVCQMGIKKTRFSFVYGSKRFYFCSRGCLEKFIKNPKNYSIKRKFDLIIIGAGPAGLTAGVYASILRIDTLLLSKDVGGQAIDSTKIKNYMGFDFITGSDLSAKFQDQLIHHHYIDHKIENVISIRKLRNYFSIRTISGHIYRAKALIVATGMVRNKLGVPGEQRFNRKGICYTAGQDIPLLAGRRVAVVGGGNSALQIVLELHRYRCKVTSVSIEPWTGDLSLCKEVRSIRSLKIFDHHAVVEIKGKEKVENILIKDLLSHQVQKLAVDAIFVAIGLSPNTSLVKHLVSLNKKGEIKINPDCSTNVPGLFAAGDVTNVFGKRIIIASGEGAKAAIAAQKYLIQN